MGSTYIPLPTHAGIMSLQECVDAEDDMPRHGWHHGGAAPTTADKPAPVDKENLHPGKVWYVESTEPGGLKYDDDKPRMELLDPYAIEELAKVLTFGANKYAAHNWRKGLAKSRLIAAALRHLFAYLAGQDKDPETGLSHVAHAMCCCMFLLGLEHRPDLDDRWKP